MLSTAGSFTRTPGALTKARTASYTIYSFCHRCNTYTVDAVRFQKHEKSELSNGRPHRLAGPRRKMQGSTFMLIFGIHIDARAKAVSNACQIAFPRGLVQKSRIRHGKLRHEARCRSAHKTNAYVVNAHVCVFPYHQLVRVWYHGS